MATAPKPGTHDRPSTEERLRESAIKHFSAKGYDATSIREIIEDAGVTRPVLYYYYKNKDDLFASLIRSELEDACAELDEVIAHAGSFQQKLEHIMKCTFARAEERPEAVQMMLHFYFSPTNEAIHLDREALSEMRFRRIVAVIEEGLQTGKIGGGDPFALAMVFTGIMDMHIMAHSNRPESRLSEELAEGLVELFLKGASDGDQLRRPLQTPFEFEPLTPEISGGSERIDSE